MIRFKNPTLLFLLCLLHVQAFSQTAILSALRNSRPVILLADGTGNPDLKLERKWSGDFCKSTITNTGSKELRLREAVILQANRLFPPATSFYAEGFQMLSQYKGTLAAPLGIGGYDDNKHYKLPDPIGYRTVYNMLILHGAHGREFLMGFNSCLRFAGKFYISADTVKVVIDLENSLIKPGETLLLEEFSLMTGSSVPALESAFAQRINHFHPRLKSRDIPAGWCSWYCFGPKVTAADITNNLNFIKQNIPGLKYVQLDDGYQPHMGDWLETGAYFGAGIQQVLKQIRDSGYEPAIWVAPFICDSNSSVFRQHPDWLVKDSTGAPLRSDRVSFGGWRLAPWYVLDGTNPGVQEHLAHVFRTMREVWGCSYFKLDANYWGAIQGGVYYDKQATRITAYRAGMKAILQATGDAFVLGCNHPLWPSLGLVHGSRSSNDISREWESFTHTGEENLHRIWQNGRLWWNDPDCVLLTGDLPENEFMYHASLLFSTGGMILSGDDLTHISKQRLDILKKMLPPAGAVTSYNNALDIGWMKSGAGQFLIVLNKEDHPRSFSIALGGAWKISNYWTGQSIGLRRGHFNTGELPAHSGIVYQLKPTGAPNR
jgi:alpha-galactosidase